MSRRGGTCTRHEQKYNHEYEYIQYTVKPVYNDNSRDQVIVVSVDGWSLYRGALVPLRWPMEHPKVVSIDRWALRQASLYKVIMDMYVHIALP